MEPAYGGRTSDHHDAVATQSRRTGKQYSCSRWSSRCSGTCDRTYSKADTEYLVHFAARLERRKTRRVEHHIRHRIGTALGFLARLRCRSVGSLEVLSEVVTRCRGRCRAGTQHAGIMTYWRELGPAFSE